jgi:hypothetical protein
MRTHRGEAGWAQSPPRSIVAKRTSILKQKRRLKSFDAEQSGHTLIAVDANDRLAKQLCDAEDGDGQSARVDWSGIGGD